VDGLVTESATGDRQGNARLARPKRLAHADERIRAPAGPRAGEAQNLIKGPSRRVPPDAARLGEDPQVIAGRSGQGGKTARLQDAPNAVSLEEVRHSVRTDL